MTIDTAPLITAVQDVLNLIFSMVPVALAIFGPIAGLGIAFKWGRQILNIVGSFLGGGGK